MGVLNREHPNDQDSAERDQTAYGPTHCVARLIIVVAAHCIGSVCRLSPVRHDRLLNRY
jgi:hypothetical protein